MDNAILCDIYNTIDYQHTENRQLIAPQTRQHHTQRKTAGNHSPPLSTQDHYLPSSNHSLSLNGEFDVSSDTLPLSFAPSFSPQNTCPVTSESFTAFTLTVRLRPCPIGSSASSFHAITGRLNVEARSENEPS